MGTWGGRGCRLLGSRSLPGEHRAPVLPRLPGPGCTCSPAARRPSWKLLIVHQDLGVSEALPSFLQYREQQSFQAQIPGRIRKQGGQERGRGICLWEARVSLVAVSPPVGRNAVPLRLLCQGCVPTGIQFSPPSPQRKGRSPLLESPSVTRVKGCRAEWVGCSRWGLPGTAPSGGHLAHLHH